MAPSKGHNWYKLGTAYFSDIIKPPKAVYALHLCITCKLDLVLYNILLQLKVFIGF